MSRSNPNLTNPAKHFFEWKGGEGKLEFYDKEQEKRITVPLPFEFLPLDQLATITGFRLTTIIVTTITAIGTWSHTTNVIHH